MRLGIALRQSSWDELRREAGASEAAGLDCCLLQGPCAIVAAATLAPATTDLRVIVEVDARGEIVELAEQLAVCDLLLGGRLVTLVDGDPAPLARALAVMTPQPAQLVLPLWPRDRVSVRRVRLADELEPLVRELRDGTGVCILDLVDDARVDAITIAGARLRPRMQGVDLPPDLIASWD